VASAQGVAAVEEIFGRGHDLNLEAVPGCIFSLPEVAGVGLTEKACKADGIAYSASKFPFAALGKAVAMGETEGLVKIIAEAQTGRILGVHIMGPHATDLIHEGALAVNLGATAADLVRTIHAHPTLSEAVLEAAHGLIDSPIHVHVPRRRQP
jgi:dihydrolipoamide dehydrogenase